MIHSTACLDWRERIVERRSLAPLPIFAEEAEAALNVFKSLRIVDVPGQPTFGEASEPWVFEFVAAIFGAYDKDNGRRLIREFFLLISKKNGKSTIAAGVMLTALIINWRYSAELLILAPTKEIADNAYNPARDMVRADPELNDLLQVQDHIRTITHRDNQAFLKVVAADSETVGGKKASFVLVDELWLFGKRANADRMLREATGGLASRAEGFVIYLSTQSDDPPEGVFKSKLEYFRDVRDGKLDDPQSLPLIYEFPEALIRKEAYLDPANFYVTNPSLGAGVDPEFLRSELAKAIRNGRDALQVFLAKHLNVQPGLAARSDNWAGAEYWKQRADKTLSLKTLIARSEVIVVGIDGGGQDDLFGLTAVGRETVEIEVAPTAAPEPSAVVAADGFRRIKRWLSWSHAWCNRKVLERRQSIAAKLNDLETRGELTILDDDAMVGGWPAMIAEVVEIIVAVRDAGILCCVVVDPARIGELIDALAEVDILETNKDQGRNFVTGARQGLALMSAGVTAEMKLANGTLLHADQELMDWSVGNLKVERLPTGFRFTKQNAGDAKIDPVMALFDAITVMATNPDAARSVYEEHGLVFF